MTMETPIYGTPTLLYQHKSETSTPDLHPRGWKAISNSRLSPPLSYQLFRKSFGCSETITSELYNHSCRIISRRLLLKLYPMINPTAPPKYRSKYIFQNCQRPKSPTLLRTYLGCCIRTEFWRFEPLSFGDPKNQLKKWRKNRDL